MERQGIYSIASTDEQQTWLGQDNNLFFIHENGAI